MIVVVATLKIRPGALEDLVAAAAPCIEATRREPGCIRYDLHASVTDPEKMVFIEEWQSRDDLELHFGRDHMKAWREAGAPFILDRQVQIIHPDKVETR